MLAQLRQTIVSRNKEVVTKLYKVFTRPILESAVVAWYPWERQDINMLEKVQRRATKLVPGIGNMDYEDRLKVCDLTTLERRRERGLMIETYKLLNGFTKMDTSDFFRFTKDRHELSTRSVVNRSLVAEKCRLDVRKFFFTNIIVHCHNHGTIYH